MRALCHFWKVKELEKPEFGLVLDWWVGCSWRRSCHWLCDIPNWGQSTVNNSMEKLVYGTFVWTARPSRAFHFMKELLEVVTFLLLYALWKFGCEGYCNQRARCNGYIPVFDGYHWPALTRLVKTHDWWNLMILFTASPMFKSAALGYCETAHHVLLLNQSNWTFKCLYRCDLS